MMTPLQEIIEPYQIKEWLIYFIRCQAVTVLCIFILLVVQKLRIEKLQHCKKTLEEGYNGAIRQYLVNQSIRMARPGSRNSYEALAEAAIVLLAELPEVEKERIRELLEGLGVVGYYQRMTGSLSWLKRYYAVERLGFLGMTGLKEHFIAMLRRDKAFAVRVRAIWALSLIADTEVLGIITEALVTELSISSKFNEYIYTNIITSFRKSGEIESFLAFLDETKNSEKIPLVLKRDLIEACGSANFHEASQQIAAYFSQFQTRSEMKIACIRGAGRLSISSGHQVPSSGMQDTELEKLIITGLFDEDWRVRAVAAGAIDIRYEQAIPTLRKLLYDPVYYVRRNAGMALARLGVQGLAVLREEAASRDKFVRDNVQFILGG